MSLHIIEDTVFVFLRAQVFNPLDAQVDQNDPVKLFSCNIFQIKSWYLFIFQAFLKTHVFDIIPLKILIYFLYILRNCGFSNITPSFHKLVKNDLHALPMESYEDPLILINCDCQGHIFCQPRLYVKCCPSGRSLYTASSDIYK